MTWADPEGGGQGVRTPLGKSQVIWVYIGKFNKELDPRPHGKIRHPWKMLVHLPHLEPWKMIVFFETNFCEIN